MAKYQTKAFTNVRPVPMPSDAQICDVAVDVELPTAALIAGDLIEIVRLPAGVRCADFALVFPKIDNGGTPSIGFALGTENTAGTDLSAEVWATGLPLGQNNVVQRNTISVSDQGITNVERIVALKVTASPATYAGANQTGRLLLRLVG